MNRAISHRQLVDIIAKEGRIALRTRQVCRRLEALLPGRLWTLQLGLKIKGAKGQRLALTHNDYLAHLDELLGLRTEAFRARIQYETHLMLLEARRSQRSWERQCAQVQCSGD